jgi:3',5'-cyclic AMP phosphodiesterase CpdA
MTEKLIFAHLTDLHIGDPDVADPLLHTDTTATLKAVLGDVKGMAPPPAFVIVSGDLTNRGDPASYAIVRRLFAEAGLAMPVLFALGNHDDRANFRETFLGGEGGAAPYDHDAVIGGLHVIVLDTLVPGRIGGTLAPAQFDWLADRLAAEPGARKLVVMHHGPMLDPDDPTTTWESIGVEATYRLAGLLAGRSDVVGILSGHIHYDRVALWHGIPIVVASGQHNATDVLYLGKGLRSLAGASFAIGTLRPSGLSVAFVPQPGDRHELNRLDAAFLQKLDAGREGGLS